LSSDEKNPSYITINLCDLSCATNVNRLCTELEDNDDDYDDDDNNNTNIVDNDSNSNSNNSLKFLIRCRVDSAA